MAIIDDLPPSGKVVKRCFFCGCPHKTKRNFCSKKCEYDYYREDKGDDEDGPYQQADDKSYADEE